MKKKRHRPITRCERGGFTMVTLFLCLLSSTLAELSAAQQLPNIPLVPQQGTGSGEYTLDTKPMQARILENTEYDSASSWSLSGTPTMDLGNNPFKTMMIIDEHLIMVPFTAKHFFQRSSNPLDGAAAVTEHNSWPSGEATSLSDATVEKFYAASYDRAVGKILCAPYSYDKVLSYNVADGSMAIEASSASPWPAGYSGSTERFVGSFMLEQNREFWMFPSQANMILRLNLDPTTGAGTTVDGFNSWPSGYVAGTRQFSSAAVDTSLDPPVAFLAPDEANQVVGVVLSGGSVGSMMKYDSWPTGFVAGSSAFGACSVDTYRTGGTSNGRVLFAPRDANQFLVLDTATGSFSSINKLGSETIESCSFDGIVSWWCLHASGGLGLVRISSSHLTRRENRLPQSEGYTSPVFAFKHSTVWAAPATLTNKNLLQIVLKHQPSRGTGDEYSWNETRQYVQGYSPVGMVDGLAATSEELEEWGKVAGITYYANGFASRAAVLVGNFIYFAPWSSSGLARWDTRCEPGVIAGCAVFKDASTFPSMIGISGSSRKFSSISYDQSTTLLWMTPYEASAIFRFNTALSGFTKFDTFPSGFYFTSPEKFSSGFIAFDYLWNIPAHGNKIVSLKLDTGLMTGYDNWPSDYNAISGYNFADSIFDGEQHAYLAPWEANMLVRIDVLPSSGSFAVMTGYSSWPAGLAYPNGYKKFQGTAIDIHGRVWFAPNAANMFVVLDPHTGGMSGVSYSTPIASCEFDSWSIFCFPEFSTDPAIYLQINCETDTIVEAQIGVAPFAQGIIDPLSQNMWLVPGSWNQPVTLVEKTPTRAKTSTASITPPDTRSATSTITPAPTGTNTPTSTGTNTETYAGTITETPTSTPEATATENPTATVTIAPTQSSVLETATLHQNTNTFHPASLTEHLDTATTSLDTITRGSHTESTSGSLPITSTATIPIPGTASIQSTETSSISSSSSEYTKTDHTSSKSTIMTQSAPFTSSIDSTASPQLLTVTDSHSMATKSSSLLTESFSPGTGTPTMIATGTSTDTLTGSGNTETIESRSFSESPGSKTPSLVPTPSATFTDTVTSAPTSSRQETVSALFSETQHHTSTATIQATRTATFSQTPSESSSLTETGTVSSSKSHSLSESLSSSESATSTSSTSMSLSTTQSPSETRSPSVSISTTTTATDSISMSLTPSRSQSPSTTPTLSETITSAPTVTQTLSITPTVTDTVTPAPTRTETSTATITPDATRTETFTPSSTTSVSLSNSIGTFSETPSIKPTKSNPSVSKSELVVSIADLLVTPHLDDSLIVRLKVPVDMELKDSSTNEEIVFFVDLWAEGDDLANGDIQAEAPQEVVCRSALRNATSARGIITAQFTLPEPKASDLGAAFFIVNVRLDVFILRGNVTIHGQLSGSSVSPSAGSSSSSSSGGRLDQTVRQFDHLVPYIPPLVLSDFGSDVVVTNTLPKWHEIQPGKVCTLFGQSLALLPETVLLGPYSVQVTVLSNTTAVLGPFPTDSLSKAELTASLPLVVGEITPTASNAGSRGLLQIVEESQQRNFNASTLSSPSGQCRGVSLLQRFHHLPADARLFATDFVFPTKGFGHLAPALQPVLQVTRSYFTTYLSSSEATKSRARTALAIASAASPLSSIPRRQLSQNGAGEPGVESAPSPSSFIGVGNFTVRVVLGADLSLFPGQVPQVHHNSSTIRNNSGSSSYSDSSDSSSMVNSPTNDTDSSNSTWIPPYELQDVLVGIESIEVKEVTAGSLNIISNQVERLNVTHHELVIVVAPPVSQIEGGFTATDEGGMNSSSSPSSLAVSSAAQEREGISQQQILSLSVTLRWGIYRESSLKDHLIEIPPWEELMNDTDINAASLDESPNSPLFRFIGSPCIDPLLLSWIVFLPMLLAHFIFGRLASKLWFKRDPNHEHQKTHDSSPAADKVNTSNVDEGSKAVDFTTEESHPEKKYTSTGGTGNSTSTADLITNPTEEKLMLERKRSAWITAHLIRSLLLKHDWISIFVPCHDQCATSHAVTFMTHVLSILLISLVLLIPVAKGSDDDDDESGSSPPPDGLLMAFGLVSAILAQAFRPVVSYHYNKWKIGEYGTNAVIPTCTVTTSVSTSRELSPSATEDEEEEVTGENMEETEENLEEEGEDGEEKRTASVGSPSSSIIQQPVAAYLEMFDDVIDVQDDDVDVLDGTVHDPLGRTQNEQPIFDDSILVISTSPAIADDGRGMKESERCLENEKSRRTSILIPVLETNVNDLGAARDHNDDSSGGTASTANSSRAGRALSVSWAADVKDEGSPLGQSFARKKAGSDKRKQKGIPQNEDTGEHELDEYLAIARDSSQRMADSTSNATTSNDGMLKAASFSQVSLNFGSIAFDGDDEGEGEEEEDLFGDLLDPSEEQLFETALEDDASELTSHSPPTTAQQHQRTITYEDDDGEGTAPLDFRRMQQLRGKGDSDTADKNLGRLLVHGDASVLRDKSSEGEGGIVVTELFGEDDFSDIDFSSSSSPSKRKRPGRNNGTQLQLDLALEEDPDLLAESHSYGGGTLTPSSGGGTFNGSHGKGGRTLMGLRSDIEGIEEEEDVTTGNTVEIFDENTSEDEEDFVIDSRDNLPLASYEEIKCSHYRKRGHKIGAVSILLWSCACLALGFLFKTDDASPSPRQLCTAHTTFLFPYALLFDIFLVQPIGVVSVYLYRKHLAETDGPESRISTALHPRDCIIYSSRDLSK